MKESLPSKPVKGLEKIMPFLAALMSCIAVFGVGLRIFQNDAETRKKVAAQKLVEEENRQKDAARRLMQENLKRQERQLTAMEKQLGEIDTKLQTATGQSKIELNNQRTKLLLVAKPLLEKYRQDSEALEKTAESPLTNP